MLAIEELRERFTKKGIPFENHDTLDFFVMRRIAVPNSEKVRFSIIQGERSYGGVDNLLEMWDYTEDEPRGYMTVDEVFEYVKENIR